MVGGNDTVMRLAAALRLRGILAPPIRPPTVSEGTARLRFSLTAEHAPEDLRAAATALAQAAREAGLVEGA